MMPGRKMQTGRLPGSRARDTRTPSGRSRGTTPPRSAMVPSGGAAIAARIALRPARLWK